MKARFISQMGGTGAIGATPSGVIYPQESVRQADIQAAQRAIEQESPVERVLRQGKQAVQAVKPVAPLTRRLGFSPFATGISTTAAMEHWQEANQRKLEGDELGSSISRLKAISETVGAIPTRSPGMAVAKGFSYPVSALLNAYDAWRLRNTPSVVTGETEEQRQARLKKIPQVKKADGGYIPLTLKDVYFHRKARG